MKNNFNKKTQKRDTKKTNKPLLSATLDIVFKKLFMENPKLLRSLLESFLDIERSSIESIEIKNPDRIENLQSQPQKISTEGSNSEFQSQESSTEGSNSELQSQTSSTSQSSSPSKLEFDFEHSTIYPENPDKKTVVMDLKVKLKTGEAINIEVQTSNQRGFKERILFYLAKLLTRDLERGKPFNEIKPAYSLVFTTFSVFNEFPEYLSRFSMIRDTSPHIVFSKSMRIILVELNKFQKSKQLLFDSKHYWCYFLKRAGKDLTEKEKDFLLKNKETKMALEHLEKMSQDESLREVALDREKNMLAIALDRKGLLQEGREEGKEEGFQKAQKAIVLNMLELNYNKSDIAKVVKCPEDEIEKLMK